MKTLLIGLMAMCSVSLALAQTGSERRADSIPVSFMGIPISGSLDSFLVKVEKKGFVVSDESSGNMSILKGPFLGENANLLILSTEAAEQVYGVVVLLQKNNNWATMKGDFNILKKMFTEQYGKPEKNDHYFTRPFDDVQDEMQKVELGMCDYLCSWNNPNIILEITKSARIIITYENNAAFRQFAGL